MARDRVVLAQVIERFERNVRRPGHRMACLLGLAGDDAAKESRAISRRPMPVNHRTNGSENISAHGAMAGSPCVRRPSAQIAKLC